jgi:beta-galactosidase
MTRTSVTIKPTLLLLFSLLTAASASRAQDVGRVSPATVPVPLPAAVPVAPDILRSRNPWVLPMTGKWRFALTRGRTVAGGLFQPAVAGANGVSASSNEEKNPPENAFDGSEATRWCADGPTYPQFLQADLGKPRPIAGLALTWERANERYRCRVEGSADGKHWKTLSDASAEQGLGDGPVALAAATARYVRVTVLGTTGNGWASIRKCALSVDEGGKNVAWRPAPVKPLPTGAHDEFARLTFNDAAWDDLAVPSNWEMAGYSIPTYNSVDTTVGQYRRWVTVPAAWAGRHIVYHFDGALDGAEVYVNGVRAGYHESGYTAWDIDLTGLVTPGRKNLFAIRVSKSTPSSDCETGDFQAMGGIYRDNFLIAIPPTHVHDITVRTPRPITGTRRSSRTLRSTARRGRRSRFRGSSTAATGDRRQ